MDWRDVHPPEISEPAAEPATNRFSLRRRLDPWWRWPSVGLLSLIALAILALFVGWLLMRGSLAQTTGTVKLVGLAGAVTVTRDAHGMPTIQAQSELDAWRVLGYTEAQDRFTQMDVFRRMAGGDLAALVGAAALPLDRKHRVFQLQERAAGIYAQASPTDRARLEVFALGVNEGLAALHVRPWPYLLLGETPRPWQPADSVLVIYAMGFLLQDPWDRRGRSLAALEALYPPSVVAFLMAPDHYWAAPMRGTLPALPPIPATKIINLAVAPAATTSGPVAAPKPAKGSNNFVVAGRFTQGGQPLLANDMHLPLGIPATWYRARLVFPSLKAPHARVELTGIFLPGVPALVAGSNGHIAWGFTNTYGDWVDIVRVPIHRDPLVYTTTSGDRALDTTSVALAVRGEKPVTLDIRHTVWGPVIGTAPDGALLVSHWSLAQPGGVNLNFMHLNSVTSVTEAVKEAAQAGMPAQNLLLADEAGHIAWTTIGRIPARVVGCDYAVPQSWADGRCGWSGWLGTEAYPLILDPANGFLATANSQVDASAAGDVLGNGGFVDGARAHQIAADLERLTARGQITTRDMLGVQLDDRAVFLTRWHDLVLEVLRPSALEYHPRRAAFRRAVADWGAHAAVDSVGYRLVRDFRLRVSREVFAPILAKLKTRYPDAELPFSAQREGPLWRLVTAQPHNWLNARYATWNALFLNAIDGVINQYWEKGSGLSKATWGERNTVALENPIGRALGPLGAWMNWPAIQLPGDTNMPRVQGPTFGASLRLVTAPAPTSASILEIPGGVSEHPLSPWYRDGFSAWAQGEPMALLPGPTQLTLAFQPWPRRLIPPAATRGSAATSNDALE